MRNYIHRLAVRLLRWTFKPLRKFLERQLRSVVHEEIAKARRYGGVLSRN